MPRKIVADTGVDFPAQQGIVKKGRAHAHRVGARNNKFQRITGIHDPALTDDGDAMRGGDLAHLVNLEQGDGLDCRPREASLDIAEYGLAGLGVYGHAHHRVDHRQGVGTGFNTAASAFLDVGLVGRKLGDQWLAGDLAAGFHDPCRHVRNVAKRHAAFLHVGTGNIDFDSVYG